MTVTARKTKWILIIGLAAVGVTVLLAVMFGLLAGGFGPSQPALVFSSAAEEFVYDGQEHIGSKWELSSGRLKEGETVVVRFAEGRTQAGVYENSFTATVLDENGSDVSESYHISYKFGAFTILPREIGIATADAEKEYDGTPLTNGSYEMTSGTLLAGHTLHAKVTGSRTLVGSISNSVEITVSDAEGRDVTKNYAFSVQEGTLTVSPIAVTVMTFSDMKVYDGEPLACPEWRITSSGLMDGDTLSADMPAEQTEVGQCENYLTDIVVRDGQGNDVSDRYDFTFYFGDLTVTPRILTIRSGDAAKEYDGDPLRYDQWEIVSFSQPVAGHEVSVSISGTITEVGEAPNTIAEVKIVDASGKDVTINYEVKPEEGRLVVTGKGLGSDPGGTDPGGSDGGDLALDGAIGGGMLLNGGSGEDTLALRVCSDTGGRVYLRLKSFGDYSFNGWQEAPVYGELLDDTYSYNYLTGIALREAGVARAHMRIEMAGSDYLLPYYLDASGLGYRIQTSDVFYEGSTDEIYEMYYYPFDYVSAGMPAVSLGKYASAEQEYAAYVRSRYLSIPASTKAFMDEIIAEQGFDRSDPYLLSDVAEYMRGAAEYNLNYDRALDEEEDVTVAFLRDYREGICQHYASAAVLLLRALGIPARYTIGYAGEVSAGEWTEIMAANAHAWVEAYVDGIGWVYVEVTGGGSASGFGDPSGGDGSGQGIKLNIRPVDEYMKYDGVSTLTHSGTLQGLNELTEAGYTYSAEVSGSRRDIGVSTCQVESFRLFDQSGEDVTDRFDITFSAGKLQMYLREITVVTAGADKVYDGTPLLGGECSLEGSLLYGHSVSVLSATGSLTSVGRSINTFRITITDASGRDVTYMYKINAEYGILEMSPREITITAGSAEKVYDGTPLMCGEYILSSEYPQALADGHRIEVVVTGSQTEVGRSGNSVASFTITDAAGNDVSANYTVRLVGGTLRVTPRS